MKKRMDIDIRDNKNNLPTIFFETKGWFGNFIDHSPLKM